VFNYIKPFSLTFISERWVTSEAAFRVRLPRPLQGSTAGHVCFL